MVATNQGNPTKSISVHTRFAVAWLADVKLSRDQGRSGACDLLDVAGATSDLELVQYNILDRNVTHRKPSGIAYSISLEQSLPHLATCYFMSVFVNLPSHTPTGTLQFITPLVRATSEDSALHAALLAVSMAALASRPNPGALVPLSREYYNKALVKMSETLSNEKRMGTDESLAAIIMLIFYEVSHQPKLVLIKLWRKRLLIRHVGTDVGKCKRQSEIPHSWCTGYHQVEGRSAQE